MADKTRKDTYSSSLGEERADLVALLDGEPWTGVRERKSDARCNYCHNAIVTGDRVFGWNYQEPAETKETALPFCSEDCRANRLAEARQRLGVLSGEPEEPPEL